MKKYIAFALCFGLVSCASNPKLTTEDMPRSGFLQFYDVLKPIKTNNDDARIWHYIKPGLNIQEYKAVIIEPIFINQSTYTEKITPEVVEKAKASLQATIYQTVLDRGNIQIVNSPAPGVARLAVGITGAEISNDGIEPWSLTPIGLAIIAASYLGGVNSKTPALLVESRITDSLNNRVLSESLVTLQGSSFRTGTGSVESFVEMGQKVVKVAIEAAGNSNPDQMH